MRKKTVAVLAILGVGLGIPGAYFQAVVSEACENFCFGPGVPTPPLLYLWTALFLAGAGLALLSWIMLAVKASEQKWGWLVGTIVIGSFGCVGFLFALIGAPFGAFIMLVCEMYLLISLFIMPETPKSESRK